MKYHGCRHIISSDELTQILVDGLFWISSINLFYWIRKVSNRSFLIILQIMVNPKWSDMSIIVIVDEKAKKTVKFWTLF